MNKIRKWLLNFVLNASAKDGWLLMQRGSKYTLEQVFYDPENDAFVIDEAQELGGLRQRALDYVLSASASDGWLLVQRGNKYTLEEATYDSDADAYRTGGGDEDELFFEDQAGRMHTFRGVPFGICNDEFRPILDADTAKTATAVDEKVTDGGKLAPQSSIKVSDVMKRMRVGTVSTQDGVAHIVNPYHHTDDEPDIVDMRPTASLLRHDSSPDAPRKAAKNAIEAERATDGLNVGNLTDWVQIVGSFLMGAIVTEYIAGSSGGGGVEVPLMLQPLIVHGLEVAALL